MKKVKVTLSNGQDPKKIFLFPNSLTLNMWLKSMEVGEQVQVSNVTELVLEPNGFIEAELIGFEYAYEKNKARRLDLVRLGLAQTPKNASGLLVSIHSGWVTGGLLPMRSFLGNDMKVEVIDEKTSLLDLDLLFRQTKE